MSQKLDYNELIKRRALQAIDTIMPDIIRHKLNDPDAREGLTSQDVIHSWNYYVIKPIADEEVLVDALANQALDTLVGMQDEGYESEHLDYLIQYLEYEIKKTSLAHLIAIELEGEQE